MGLLQSPVLLPVGSAVLGPGEAPAPQCSCQRGLLAASPEPAYATPDVGVSRAAGHAPKPALPWRPRPRKPGPLPATPLALLCTPATDPSWVLLHERRSV